MQKKVLVAMSGGVDSSAAAYLLKEKGYNIAGVTMCFGIPDSADNTNAKCCGAKAVEDAKKICMHIDIPHYVLDFSSDLKKYVIDNFISEYSKARTPNPCVRCNEFLKFGKLLKYAKNMGFDYIATGHYAEIININGEFLLKRPKDRKKDQTYFLYCIKKEYLPNILFPLWEYTKEEVRKIALNAGLDVAHKPQSQDICFVPGNNYREFLSQKGINSEKGEIIDINGNFLGYHSGIINYTLGQRNGLGVAIGHPQYIISIDKDNNKIVIGEKGNLISFRLKAKRFNQLKNDFSDNITAQIRYQHEESPCKIQINGDKSVDVIFKSPQDTITPGQSIVFYEDDVLLGGAIIDSIQNEFCPCQTFSS